MLLLPVADARGVLGVAEVILVLRFGQPSSLRLPFPCLTAGRLATVVLALGVPVIGKKKFLAVQALASRFGRLHRFQLKRIHYRPRRTGGRRKPRPKKTQNREEGRKVYSECAEENSAEEDPVPDRQFCITWLSPVARRPAALRAQATATAFLLRLPLASFLSRRSGPSLAAGLDTGRAFLTSNVLPSLPPRLE